MNLDRHNTLSYTHSATPTECVFVYRVYVYLGLIHFLTHRESTGQCRPLHGAFTPSVICHSKGPEGLRIPRSGGWPAVEVQQVNGCNPQTIPAAEEPAPHTVVDNCWHQLVGAPHHRPCRHPELRALDICADVLIDELHSKGAGRSLTDVLPQRNQ